MVINGKKTKVMIIMTRQKCQLLGITDPDGIRGNKLQEVKSTGYSDFIYTISSPGTHMCKTNKNTNPALLLNARLNLCSYLLIDLPQITCDICYSLPRTFSTRNTRSTTKEIFTYQKHEPKSSKTQSQLRVQKSGKKISLALRQYISIYVFKACFLNSIFDSDARDHKHFKCTILVNLLILYILPIYFKTALITKSNKNSIV